MPLDPERLERMLHLVQQSCEHDLIPAAGLAWGSREATARVVLMGRQRPGLDQPALRDDALFLIASLTKPIVGMAVVQLAERGLLTLDDRVERFVPEFGKRGKHAVTLRHLLTHTSGLPDMLPRNEQLRAANAPLSEFVREICELTPDFPAGRMVQYQSTGFAMLAEIVRRVAGQECRDYLAREFFEPIGMRDTVLGAPASWFEGDAPRAARIADVRLNAEQAQQPGWNWNSRYWRSFGAPWGGLLTTPHDLALYLRMMLSEGAANGRQILSPLSVRAAIANQLGMSPGPPEDDRKYRPWGLGWRLNWRAHSSSFGDLLGEAAYGHWGATGTLFWADPQLDLFLVLLTTQPQEPNGRELARISNAFLGSVRP